MKNLTFPEKIGKLLDIDDEKAYAVLDGDHHSHGTSQRDKITG